MATGIVVLTGRSISRSLGLARAVATACLLVVTVVHNGFVPGTGSARTEESVVLHIVYPILVMFDWGVISDHDRVPLSQLWLMLPNPLTWMTVVEFRGATDRRASHGFLLFERGAFALASTTAGLAALLLLAGAFVWIWPKLATVCRGTDASTRR